MMEQRHERNEADQFGFDPVSPKTHTYDQSKEQNTTSDHNTREMQHLSDGISTKLSHDEASPTPCRSTTRIPDSSFNGLKENNTSKTADFWGFDPPDNVNEKSHASGQVRPQQGHKTKRSRGKRRFNSIYTEFH